MKYSKYLSLLCVGLCSTTFAFSFSDLSSKTLTCPQSYPTGNPTDITQLGPNYYGNQTPFRYVGNNTYTYSFVMVNATSAADAKNKIKHIIASSLTSYTVQPITYSPTQEYCTYHSSQYPLPNESPNEAGYSQTDAAFVMFYTRSNQH